MKHEQGIALIQVLLIAAILSVLAMFLTKTAKSQVTVAKWIDDKAQAMVNIHSTEAKLMFTLLTEPLKYQPHNIDNPDELVRQWNFHGRPFSITPKVSVQIQDQSGLMYVYKPNIKRLSYLLTNHGLDNNQSEHLVASLLDWQDIDSIKHFNGAESTNYGFPIRNGKVTDIHELIFIENISPSILALLTENLSLHKRASFNPLVAPRAVLQAFFQEYDLNESVVNEIITIRNSGELTKKLFTEVTEIKENDEREILFTITNILSVKLISTVGESSVIKNIIFNFNPYVFKNNRPVNYYSNRG